MANLLACALLSDRTPSNTAHPGDTIRFVFSNPPKQATNVTIDIIQAAPRTGVEVVTSSVLVTYTGDIVDHKFRTRTRQLRPAPKIVNAPVLVSDGSSSDEIALLDDGLVYGHELKVDVRGEVGTSTVFFQGQTPLAVFYPLVMIAPTPTAKGDLTLNVLGAWAEQWAAVNTKRRKLIAIRPTVPPASASDSDYDVLVDSFAQAASFAPFGIVALATGHGDGGQGVGNPGDAWCHLVPEDKAPTVLPDGSEVFAGHTRFINHPNLIFGSTRGNLIMGQDKVKLLALERIADVLTSQSAPIRNKFPRFPIISPLRKLILHTCNAGNDAIFVARFADRVGVRTQAHLDFIEYSGAADSGSIVARYAGDPAATKGSKTEWPTSNLGREQIPISLQPSIDPRPRRDPPRTAK